MLDDLNCSDCSHHTSFRRRSYRLNLAASTSRPLRPIERTVHCSPNTVVKSWLPDDAMRSVADFEWYWCSVEPTTTTTTYEFADEPMSDCADDYCCCGVDYERYYDVQDDRLRTMKRLMMRLMTNCLLMNCCWCLMMIRSIRDLQMMCLCLIQSYYLWSLSIGYSPNY